MWDIEQLRDELRALVRIESPYFHEHDVIEYASHWLERRGFSVQRHSYRDDVVTKFCGENIIVTLEGKPGGPTLCLNGHLDTVPVCDGWTHDPFAGEVEGDRLYGVGAADMKSGCLALMLAVDRLAHEKEPFWGKIILTLVSVEEGPFGLGTNALIEDGLLDGVDCSLVTEPTGAFSGYVDAPVISLGARGNYVYHVDLHGISSHASLPEQGVNAAELAAKFVEAATAKQPDLKGELGCGSLCLLKIHADGGTCSAPDIGHVLVHRHVNELEDEAYVMAEAERFCEEAGLTCRREIYVRKSPSPGSHNFPPYYIKQDNPFAQKLHAAVLAACGKEPAYRYFASIGDFNYLGTRLNGAPCLLLGAAGDNVHGADEYVLLSSLQDLTESVYHFLRLTLVKQA